MTEELDHINLWRGTYRDVTFEIKNFKIPGTEQHFNQSWCYYIWLLKDRVSERFKKEVFEAVKKEPNEIYPHGRFWNYYELPFIHDCKMHGGVTYFKMHNDGQAIEFGCDYQHYWDEGNNYQLDDLVRDAKNSIDKLYENGALPKEQK